MPLLKQIEIFYIYSDEKDRKFKEKKTMLDNHLSFVKRREDVHWENYELTGGSEIKEEIEKRLNNANIILFLISVNYFVSKNYPREAEIALSRHRRGEAWVIPIIFRPCDWEKSEFGLLSPLPRQGKDIFSEENGDKICQEVQQGILQVIDEWKIKQEVQQQIERADLYFKQQAYDEADAVYTTALLQLRGTVFNKDKADLLRKIGSIQVASKQKEAALKYYEQAIQQSASNPMLPILYKEQSEILLNLQRWEATIRACDQAIKLTREPGMETIEIVQMYKNKGEALIGLKRFGDALIAFDMAIEQEPENFHLWQHRGEICTQLRDIKGVKRSYEEAIRLAGDNAYFHHEYGKRLFTLQQYIEALGEYYKALALKPNLTQAYQNLSEVYTELARQAQEEYTRRKNNGG